MSKKTLAALALSTALFTNIYAGSCQINSGAYVGLSIGGAHLGGKNETTYSNDNPGNIAENVKQGLSNTSFAAAILAGYGLKLNSLWVAAELFYQFDQLKTSNTMAFQGHGEKKVESKSNGTFGGRSSFWFYAKPGFCCLLNSRGRS